MKTKTGPVIGIDIGGTNIKLGVVSNSGAITLRNRIATRTDRGPEPTLERIAAAIKAVKKRTKVTGVGIGIAGLIDHKRGIVRVPPNLPGWDGLNLKKALEQKTGLRISVGNDVNACVLGELHFGAGRGAQDIFCITLGTGVGGGAISAGRLVLGAHDSAVEVGHTIVDPRGPRCKCGNTGCLERFVGAEYLVADAGEGLKKEPSLISELAGGSTDAITPKVIAQAARKGDGLGRRIIDKVGYYVGLGVVNIVHLFDPTVVVIGGGIARSGKILLEAVIRTAASRILMYEKRNLKIILSKLGADAGVLGASCFIKQIQ